MKDLNAEITEHEWIKRWRKSWRDRPTDGWGPFPDNGSPLCLDCCAEKNSLKKAYLLLSKHVLHPRKILVLTPDYETAFRWRKNNPGARDAQMAYEKELEDDYRGPCLEDDYRAWESKTTRN